MWGSKGEGFKETHASEEAQTDGKCLSRRSNISIIR